MRWQSFHQMCDGNYHVPEGPTKIARPFHWRDAGNLTLTSREDARTPELALQSRLNGPKYRPYYGPAREYYSQDLQIANHDSRETSVAGTSPARPDTCKAFIWL